MYVYSSGPEISVMMARFDLLEGAGYIGQRITWRVCLDIRLTHCNSGGREDIYSGFRDPEKETKQSPYYTCFCYGTEHSLDQTDSA